MFCGASRITFVLALSLSAAPALAQSDAASSEGREPSTQLEDIVVTATKREKSLREIPASISALSGEQIETRGIQNLDEIIEAIPGVNLVDEKSCVGCPDAITIRGISAARNTVGTAGLFFDEIALVEPFIPIAVADISPFDLQTVEVLKGPVGTLFGGSALNGAIRYIPRQPEFESWEVKGYGELRALDESNGLSRNVGLVVNVPVYRDVALRVLATRNSFPGQIDSTNPAVQREDVDWSKQDTFRAAVRAQPLDRLEVSATYLTQQANQGDLGFTSGTGKEFERSADPTQSFYNIAVKMWQLKGTWTLPFADLTFAAGHSSKTLDGYYDLTHSISGGSPVITSTVPLLTSVLDGVAEPASEELRLVSTGKGNWDWLLGLYNFHYDVDLNIETSSGDNPVGAAGAAAFTSLGINQNLFSTGGGVESISVRGAGTVFERALFGEASWRFREGFEAILGARLYRFSYDVAYYQIGGSCVLALDPTACDPVTQSGQSEFVAAEAGVSPKLGLKWQITPDLMSFATLSRGFRFGGVNVAAHPEIPPFYQSDSLWNAELGVRSSWLDRTLIADATAFALDWTDAQYQQSTSDGVSGYIDNIGRVKGLGTEGQLIWATPLPGLSLTLVGTYTDIRTRGDFTGASGTTVKDGTRWPRAPLLEYNVTAGWNGWVGGSLLGLSLTRSYQGPALQGFRPADAGVIIFDYATLGLHTTLKPLAQIWMPELALNANNLTNERQNTFFQSGTGAGATIQSFNAPRNVSLRLTWNL